MTFSEQLLESVKVLTRGILKDLRLGSVLPLLEQGRLLVLGSLLLDLSQEGWFQAC